MKKIIFVFVLALLLVVLGKGLNPFSPDFVEFHDLTQNARMHDFKVNILNLKLPPRLAPDFSFGLGYPLYNFYAPTAYWISAVLNFFLPDVNALKMSFLLALAVGFLSSFLLFRRFFSFSASIIGAALYASNAYLASDIFVRGNLAEAWFVALLPLPFFTLHLNAQSTNKWPFIVSALSVFITLTSHNVLSLFLLPVLFLYVLLLPKKSKNFLSLFIGLLLGSYFFIPLAIEQSLTYATHIAKLTNFNDHFLCGWQLWESPWGFGGSAPGCLYDGMSFKIGKIQIISALSGVSILAALSFMRKKETQIKVPVFFLLLSVFSLFLTTYASQWAWNLLSPVLSLAQFPWRFIALSLPGIAFFGAYLWDWLKIPAKQAVTVAAAAGILAAGSKYFTRPAIPGSQFSETYAGSTYMRQEAAYYIAEYLPKTVDYSFWRQFQPQPGKPQTLPVLSNLPIDAQKSTFTITKNELYEKIAAVYSPQTVTANIHYFPFWQIKVNGSELKPVKFDRLGRPLIKVNGRSTVEIKYRQTPVEQAGNLLSSASFLMLIITAVNKKMWKKIA